MSHLDFDVAHLLAGSLVLVSFILLYQDRLYALLNVYAVHALVLALSVAWQAFIQHAPYLYVTAAIALGFKAIIIPVALRRIVERLGIHREIETVVGIGSTMLAGMALVALSMVVMLRVTSEAAPIAREDLAWPPGHGDAAQCRWPGRGIHVARERIGTRGDRRQGHAARRRNQRRLLDPHRLHCHRHLSLSYP
jgi:hypothetical protein